jgi:hypothetical protein
MQLQLRIYSIENPVWLLNCVNVMLSPTRLFQSKDLSLLSRYIKRVGSKKKKFAVRPKLKVDGGGFLAHIMLTMCFLKSFDVLVFYQCLKILRRVNFFSEHSVCGQKFLPPTHYAGNNFYRNSPEFHPSILRQDGF